MNSKRLRTPGGERVRYDIWLLSAAIVMSVLSEYFRPCLREHSFTFAMMSTISILLTANQKKLSAVNWCRFASIRDQTQQRADVIEETGGPFEETLEDSGDFEPAALEETTLKDQFELKLKSFYRTSSLMELLLKNNWRGFCGTNLPETLEFLERTSHIWKHVQEIYNMRPLIGSFQKCGMKFMTLAFRKGAVGRVLYRCTLKSCADGILQLMQQVGHVANI